MPLKFRSNSLAELIASLTISFKTLTMSATETLAGRKEASDLIANAWWLADPDYEVIRSHSRDFDRATAELVDAQNALRQAYSRALVMARAAHQAALEGEAKHRTQMAKLGR